MKKVVYSSIFALAGILPANAQYSFTIDGGFSGDCAKVSGVRELNQQLQQIKGQTVSGFPDEASCNQARNMVNSIKAQAELIVIDARTGRTIDRKKYNCHFSLNASTCTGRPMSGPIIGVPNINGVSQGTSFHSTNGSNEIRDWSEYDIERMIALCRETVPYYEEAVVSTGDKSFDETRGKYEFTGRMPEGSTSLINKDSEIVAVGPLSKGTGVVVPDDFMSKTVYGSEATSDDLKTVNIELGPIQSSNFKEEYEKEESEFWSDIFSSLDESLDYYNALNNGDANFLQYIYTRWGKENIMAGFDWWERNDIGTRLTNAASNVWNTLQDVSYNALMHPIDTYDNVREGAIDKIKENIDNGIGSTIKFLLPSQYEKAGENAGKIYNTEISVIQDALKILKDAPEMISRGETIDPVSHLNKANEKVQGLATSIVAPELSKPYKKLYEVEDIYNLPKEKQKKELENMLKKEGGEVVKAMTKQNKYYKKWQEKWEDTKKKAQNIVDPYHFIFD